MVMEEEQSHMELASESVPVPQIIITNELRNNDIATPKKKPRLRKKALHAAVRKQMEFYFGDANLSKDRFLGNLIKKDPYVELQVFLKFNKIRSLTTDINQVVRALQKSDMLSVSEDGSKVCRVTPISQKDNIDECTIYVQRLPLNADHEWLSNVFSQYGTVSYVSIPRYKSNKRIKGFAFVEFEDVSSAAKCIKGFGEKGCVLPSQTSPDSLLSITTFHEEEMMEKQRETQDTEEAVSADSKEKFKQVEKVQTEEKDETVEAEESQKEVRSGKKRKQESDKQDDEEVDAGSKTEKKNKKLKQKSIEDEIDGSSSELIEKDEGCNEQKKKDLEVERKDDKEADQKLKKRKVSEISKEEKNESLNEGGNKQNEDSADSEKEKKSKKRKQRIMSGTKHRETSESVEEEKDAQAENDIKVENEEADDVFKDVEVMGEEDQKKKRKRKRHNRAEKVDTADIGMQIMAKRDWKTLRNKYLELQRSKMKSLKTHLKRTRWNQWNNYEKFRESDKSKVFKDEGKENTDADQKDDKSTQRFVFTPGVIVRVEMDEPCTDPKSFKMELKRNSNIKYIDIAEGASEAFLRCDTNEAAKALVLQSNEERSMSILQDKEETEYWTKMSKDREEKLGKKIRVKQRGRDKLLKKAEKELGKHIKFDEV